MSNSELPQWMQEIGRSPAPHQCGRPTPAIPDEVKHAKAPKEVNETDAAKLEQDFRTVINSCCEDDEAQITARILNAMTGNRLHSRQAYRLLASLYRKFDGTAGISVIDAAGDVHPLNRWGAT